MFCGMNAVKIIERSNIADIKKLAEELVNLTVHLKLMNSKTLLKMNMVSLLLPLLLLLLRCCTEESDLISAVVLKRRWCSENRFVIRLLKEATVSVLEIETQCTIVDRVLLQLSRKKLRQEALENS